MKYLDMLPIHYDVLLIKNDTITKLKRSVFGPYLLLKIFQKMRMSEKCRNKHNNNNSNNPLTSRRTDGGKNSKSHRALDYKVLVPGAEMYQSSSSCP